MKSFITDFLFVLVLAGILCVGAWFAGDLAGYRRQVAELAAQLEAAKDEVRKLEYERERLRAQVGSAAAEILERRMSPEQSYERLLQAMVVVEK